MLNNVKSLSSLLIKSNVLPCGFNLPLLVNFSFTTFGNPGFIPKKWSNSYFSIFLSLCQSPTCQVEKCCGTSPASPSHDLVRPKWWWRNGATVSGKLDCSQGCWQTCGINIAQMGVSMAGVQTMDKTEIVTMIVSMDKTVEVDMISLA